MSIQEKAMRINLHISQWTARKQDKKITAETIAATGAQPESGSWTKALIAKKPLQAIKDVVTAARAYHKSVSAPWGDGGDRIIAADLLMEYRAKMAEFSRQFYAAVNEFIPMYPDLIDEAMSHLGTGWNQEDYPVQGEILNKFQFKISFDTITDANDFRVQVSDLEAARYSAEIRSQVQEDTDRAMRALWTRLYAAVKHMLDRLSAPELTESGRRAPFHKSVIENIKTQVDILDRLNFTNDPELAEMIDTVGKELCSLTTDEIKKSPAIKIESKETAEAIIAKMSAIMGGAPSIDEQKAA
ncbi:MAG: hypothetical protein JEZ11_04015 [Desulfobacterales bacterium]|nr:hypothetical protein [Desulfobacterales bacterium]